MESGEEYTSLKRMVYFHKKKAAGITIQLQTGVGAEGVTSPVHRGGLQRN